ncbi:MarR family winged helix-turn-helix transcriptional regulator [Streptomyces sp. NPDC059009]|uniref:MarR family winged helix-turn-helix transcriptional regulator n=1 Tax=Streptomyces sp. NPDC059009 TaxID=3346694 RepID=UPI0036A1CDAD
MPEKTGEPGAPREPAPEQLADDLATAVRLVVRRLRSAAPDAGLSPSQRSVLSRLDADGPATTAALARAELVRPQSMRLTVGALAELGLVERAPDPDDGRQSVVSLTGRGRGTLTDGRAARRSWLAAALAEEYDADERRRLADAVALLERLVRP